MTTTSKTFIIPKPWKHYTRYSRLTDAQSAENKETRKASEAAFVEFIKLSLATHAPSTEWNVVGETTTNGWFNIKVNETTTLYPKFREDFIMLDNGGNTSKNTKVSGQFYYEKELTFAKNGKKMCEIVTSSIKRNEAATVKANITQSNAELVVKIARSLVQAGKITMRNMDNTEHPIVENGFEVSNDEYRIMFKYTEKYTTLFSIYYSPLMDEVSTSLHADATRDITGSLYNINVEGRDKFNAALSKMQNAIEKMGFYATLIADEIKTTK